MVSGLACCLEQNLEFFLGEDRVVLCGGGGKRDEGRQSQAMMVKITSRLIRVLFIISSNGARLRSFVVQWEAAKDRRVNRCVLQPADYPSSSFAAKNVRSEGEG